MSVKKATRGGFKGDDALREAMAVEAEIYAEDRRLRSGSSPTARIGDATMPAHHRLTHYSDTPA